MKRIRMPRAMLYDVFICDLLVIAAGGAIGNRTVAEARGCRIDYLSPDGIVRRRARFIT
jgi:hypothetical protein